MAKRTPIKAIRVKCLDCCCGQAQEVRLCIDEECPLWEYRMAIDPKRINCLPKMRKPKKAKLAYGFL